MNHALFIAKTGLEAQELRLATIANNIANANTIGFKKGRAEFVDLMYQNIRQPGAKANANEDSTLPSGLQIGTGTKAIGVQKIHTQGNIIVTDNKLDVSINGRGFFKALDQNGVEMFFRDGSFQLNQNGHMVTSSGHLLEPAINIPADAVEIFIAQDGEVSVKQPGDPTPAVVGQIELSTFLNPSGLEAIGNNFFIESLASGVPANKNPQTDEAGSLLQGTLESSNVSTVEELVAMIQAQRTFEMNSKAISAADGMMRFLNNNI